MSKQAKRLSVVLTDAELTATDRLAHKYHCTRSAIVRHALAIYLDAERMRGDRQAKVDDKQLGHWSHGVPQV